MTPAHHATATLLPDPHMLSVPTRLEDVDWRLAARSMSRLYRFGGRGLFPLRVATHACALSRAVPPRLERAALVHDVSEVWFGDVPSNVKRFCPEYQVAERAFQDRLFGWLGLPTHQLDELHFFDVAIRADEARAIMPDVTWAGHPGFGFVFVPTDDAAAEEHWLDMWANS